MNRFQKIEIEASIYYVGLAIKLVSPYCLIAEKDFLCERGFYARITTIGRLHGVNVIAVDKKLLIQRFVFVCEIVFRVLSFLIV